jgi:hypothetical protein
MSDGLGRAKAGVRRVAALRGAFLFLAGYGIAGWASLFVYDWSIFSREYATYRLAVNAHSTLSLVAIVGLWLARLRAEQWTLSVEPAAREPLASLGSVGEILVAVTTAILVAAIATGAEAIGPRTLEHGVPGLRPNATFTLDTVSRRPEIVVHTNAHGFRDDAWAPRSGRYRVVLVGDSLVFGSGITEQSETVTRVLDRLLAAQGAEARNLSLNGLNTTQEVALIDAHAGDVDPDLLVVVHNAENDLMPVLPYYEQPRTMMVFPLGFVSFVNAIDRYMQTHELHTAPGALEGLQRDVDRLAAIADSDGFDVLWLYMRADCPLPYHRAPSRGHVRRFAFGTLGRWPEALLFPNDFHPNPRGVEVMAERIAERVAAFRTSSRDADGDEPVTRTLEAECGR